MYGKIISKLKISPEIKNTLIFRFIYYGVSALSLFLTTIFFNDQERGYYFTFVSFVGIYSILDLGLGQTLLIIFSRENKDKKNKLKKLLFITRKIYRLISILFLLLSFLLGFNFFTNFGDYDIQWKGPWILTVISTSILLLNSSKLIYVEASGKLSQVAKMRSFQTFFANIIFIFTLISNFGLWSFAFYQFSLAIISIFYLNYSKSSSIYRKDKVFNENLSLSKILKFWKLEIFPLQWKMSINYLCGLIIFQLFTPIVFSNFGPELAGRVGFSLNVTNSIVVISSSFVTASIPMISRFISENNRNLALINFKTINAKSIIFSLLILIPLFIFTILYGNKFSNILLMPLPTLLIMCSSVCHIYIYNLATYFRIFKKDPMIPLSIFSAVSHILLYFYTKDLSLINILFFIFLINLFISIQVSKLFRNFKKKGTF